MPFIMSEFMELVTRANDHFEHWVNSSLHTLITYLKRYPTQATPSQIAGAINGISHNRQVKYKEALDYVRQTILGTGMPISQSTLTTARLHQTHVVPNTAPPPPRRPDMTQVVEPSTKSATFSGKVKAFDKISRKNVVLSGHGCWAQEADNTWPFVRLGAGQEIHFYCGHKYPLGNDVGQQLDNHQKVTPVEIIKGPTNYYDYTLQPKDTLRLLNRMKGANGQQLDARFITVDACTRLHDFINNPANATAVLHWAACRVVFNNLGQKEDPVSGTWLDWDDVTHTWV